MSRSKDTVIACYSLDGKLIKIYKTAVKAAIDNDLFFRTIDRATRNDIVTVKNMIWRRYKINEVPATISPIKKESRNTISRPIAKLDENDKIVETYKSIKYASKINKIDPHSLRDRLNNKYRCFGKTKFRYLTELEAKEFGY